MLKLSQIQFIFHWMMLLGGTKKIYLVLTILTAFISILRSYSFIHYFDDYTLGVFALFQSSSSMLAMSHFGLLNGGFRLLSTDDEHLQCSLRSTVSVSLFWLFLLIFLCAALLRWLGFLNSSELFSEAVALGILMILQNWYTNVLLASGKHLFQSILLFVSQLLSISLFFLFEEVTAEIGAFVLIFAPLFFNILFVVRFGRPLKIFTLDFVLFKRVVSIGVPAFISGLVLSSQGHFEKWFVALTLGRDFLGQLYLFYTFVTLWQIIPKALRNITLPLASRMSDNSEQLDIVLGRFNRNLLLFGLIGLLLLFSLGKMLVLLFLPASLDSIRYVYMGSFGLFVLLMSETQKLALFVSLKMRYLMQAEVLFLLCSVFSMSMIYYFGLLNLNMLFVLFFVNSLLKYLYLKKGKASV